MPNFKSKSKNAPVDEKLWAEIQALAKGERKKPVKRGDKTVNPVNKGDGFTTFPSAYANGWALSQYKRLGGKWKKVSSSKVAKSVEEVPSNIHFLLNPVSSSSYEILMKIGDKIIGHINFRTNSDCGGAYEIWNVKAPHGYGPILYDLVMELSGKKGIMSDRGSVTKEALKVWDYYLKKRNNRDVIALSMSEEVRGECEEWGDWDGEKESLDFVYYLKGVPTKIKYLKEQGRFLTTVKQSSEYKKPRKWDKEHCESKTCDEMGFSEKASCRPYKNCYKSASSKGKPVFLGTDIPFKFDFYFMRVEGDYYYHYTYRDRAKEIIEDGYLRPNFYDDQPGAQGVFAISGSYGQDVKNTQVSGSRKKHMDKIVAVKFKTRTEPEYGYPEEVVWDKPVKLIRPEIVSVSEAVSDLKRNKDLGDRFIVYYDSKKAEELKKEYGTASSRVAHRYLKLSSIPQKFEVLDLRYHIKHEKLDVLFALKILMIEDNGTVWGGDELGEIEGAVVQFENDFESPCYDDIMTLKRKYPELGRFGINIAFVSESEIYEDYLGKRLGDDLYLEFIRYIWDELKVPFIFAPHYCVPNGSTSASARKLWGRLARKFPSSGDSILISSRP